MAELIQQPIEVRKRFRRMISESERRRRELAVEKFERDIPVIGTLLAPLRNLALFDQDLRNGNRGDDGEGAVGRSLRRLPSPWCYLNNVVLEHKPGEFMQIDHIAVGPTVVVVIETKKWRGAILGDRDVFRVKFQGRWTRIESPTQQAKWHAQAIRRCLMAAGVPIEVTPVVVFVDPNWLRVQNCSCPVFHGTRELRRYLLSQETEQPPGAPSCRQIGETLAAATSIWDLPQGKQPSAPRPVGSPRPVPAFRKSLPAPLPSEVAPPTPKDSFSAPSATRWPKATRKPPD